MLFSCDCAAAATAFVMANLGFVSLVEVVDSLKPCEVSLPTLYGDWVVWLDGQGTHRLKLLKL